MLWVPMCKRCWLQPPCGKAIVKYVQPGTSTAVEATGTSGVALQSSGVACHPAAKIRRLDAITATVIHIIRSII